MADGVRAGGVFVELGAKVDREQFAAYDRELRKVREQVARREQFKAQLGADYDGRAFRAFERDLRKTSLEVKRAEIDAHKMNLKFDDTERSASRAERGMTRLASALRLPGGNIPWVGPFISALNKLASVGQAVGGIFGGGGALVGALAGLGGAAAAGVVALGALIAVFAAVAGAAVALVGSLGAAAAGIAAIGVGAAAALGPLAALGGAVIARFGVITTAYKALETQQQKGGVQATSHAKSINTAAQSIKTAEQGVADAQRTVTKAQNDLTAARFKARREVQDLAGAVTHAALAEGSASLTLWSAQKRLAQVQIDPNASMLDRAEAQHAVREAVQGTSDAQTTYGRALTDRKRGTDTVAKAQQALNDAIRAERRAEDQVTVARHAATAATQKQGAAADTAQAKLAELTKTERHLLTTMRGFSDTLQKVFAPATDAIFAGVDGALKRLTPVLGRFTGRFHEIGVSIGQVITNASKSLAGPEWGRALDSFIATSRKVVKPISDSIGSVLVILRNIAVATQPYVVALANGISRAMGGFAAKTQDAAKVRDVVRELVKHTKSWFDLTLAVGKLLFTIFNSSAGSGRSLVQSLTTVVNKWNTFLNTREGQRRLHEFFHNAVELTKKLFTALVEIAGALVKISAFFLNLGTHLGGIGKFITDHTTLVKGAIAAWVTLKTAMLAANAVAAVGVLRGAAGAAVGGAAAKGAVGGAAAGTGLKGVLGKIGPAVGLGAGAAAGASLASAAIVSLGSYKALSESIKGASSSDLGLLDKYAKAIEKVSKAGDAGGMRKLATQLRETAAANKDITKGDHLKGFADALDIAAKSGGKDLGALKAAFAAMGKSSGGDLRDVATAVKRMGSQSKPELDGVGQAVKHAQDRFLTWRREGGNSIHDLRVDVGKNLVYIRNHLGSDTAAGKEAAAKNFRAAAAAIRASMNSGQMSVSKGLAEIKRLMRAELKVYGITGTKADNYLSNPTGDLSGKGSVGQPGSGQGAARGGFIKRALQRGGWIGSRGEAGHDDVPIGDNAIAARGEFYAAGRSSDAILNRHQQPYADAALAAGGFGGLAGLARMGPQVDQVGILDSVLGGGGGLAGLFSAITRPHFLASGGLKRRFSTGGTGLEGLNHTYPAGVTLSPDQVMAIAQSVGLPSRAFEQIAHGESSYQPGAIGHDPGGTTGYGLWQMTTGVNGAAFEQFVNSLGGWNEMLNPLKNAQAAKWLYDRGGMSHWYGTKYLGVAGSAGGGGGGHAAVHRTAKPIRAPRTTAKGALGQIIQAGLNRVAGAATRKVQSALDAQGAAGGGPRGGGASMGPSGVGSFEGIPMANWVIEALNYARSKGFTGHPTSGYRPGFDPHTASGTSEHQGRQYPHGAVDFGGFNTGLGIKMGAVNATRDFKYPLLAPIGFHDDGHASGTGHAQGGFFATGGSPHKTTHGVVHAAAARAAAAKTKIGFGKAASSAWRIATNIMRSPGPTPRIVFTPRLASGRAYAHFNPGNGNVAISDAMLQAYRDPKNRNHDYALKALVHEFAHARQRRDDTDIEREGGAETFAMWAAPQVMRGARIPYHHAQAVYPFERAWVRKNRDERWWKYGQFHHQGVSEGPKPIPVGGDKGGATRGGLMQRFSRGGSWYHGGGLGAAASRAMRPISTAENRGFTRSIRRREAGIKNYETDIQRMEREYGQMDRRFSETDEILLIEHDDGSATVDDAAVAERVGELDALITKREEIRQKIIDYRAAIVALIDKLNSVVARLRAALHAAKGKAREKDRSGYRAAIEVYTARAGELGGMYEDLAGDITDQDIDLEELGIERGAVAGTTGRDATPTTPETPDTSSAATDAAAGPTPDQQALLDQTKAQLDLATSNATINAQALRAFASSGDIGTGGRNALNVASLGAMGGGSQALQSGENVVSSGMASPQRSGRDINITIQSLVPPTGAQAQLLADSVVSALAQQPSINSSTQKVG